MFEIPWGSLCGLKAVRAQGSAPRKTLTAASTVHCNVVDQAPTRA